MSLAWVGCTILLACPFLPKRWIPRLKHDTARLCYASSTWRFRGVPGKVKSMSAVIVAISDSFPDGPTALTPNVILPATSGNDEMPTGSVTSVMVPTST
jgi:hypothetical protein